MTKLFRQFRFGLGLAWALALVACDTGDGGGGGGGGTNPPPPPPPPVCGTGVDEGSPVAGTATGHLYYLKRQVDPDIGLGSKAAALRLPVREAEVEAIRESDCLVTGTAVTGPDGSFSLTIPDGQRALIRAYARRQSSDYKVQVQKNRTDLAGLNVSSATLTMNDGMSLPDLVAGLDDPDRPAGAFNIFQVILDAIDEVKTLNGGLTPPLITVYWFSGNNSSSTYFNPANDVIQLIGGRAGLQDSTDTDEFDDAVILHEYAHFLIRHYSRDDNPGGYHGGEDLDPRLAYGEGLATFLSAMLRNLPDYIDTYGSADDTTGLFISENLEDFSASPAAFQFYTGIGSEESVEIVLWDFYDDTSLGEAFDTLSAGADGIWEALQDMIGQSFTYILDLADVLADQDPVNPAWTAGIRDILAEENIGTLASFPPTPTDDPDFFPERLDLSGAVIRTGAVDSTFVYANGGTNLGNGSHSSRFYGLVVSSSGRLSATLNITGPVDGLPLGAQPHDLDLRLYNSAGSIIAASESYTSAVETISANLPPGEYMIEVAGDFRIASFPIDNPYQGQVASYSLTAGFAPAKKQAPIPLLLEVASLQPGIARVTLQATAPLSADEVKLELLLPPGAALLDGQPRGLFRLKQGESRTLSVVVELDEEQWTSLAGRASIRAGRHRFAREVYASTD
ncbi:MAG: hypothetical protein A2V67_07880 [Deltaproteobacteria bacterium RBG_13_61_14]|nr:MAG: hypothetical protein A2V67_07880 [Deltaproteobacteria bacterium RBG_13_61_14]